MCVIEFRSECVCVCVSATVHWNRVDRTIMIRAAALEHAIRSGFRVGRAVA